MKGLNETRHIYFGFSIACCTSFYILSHVNSSFSARRVFLCSNYKIALYQVPKGRGYKAMPHQLELIKHKKQVTDINSIRAENLFCHFAIRTLYARTRRSRHLDNIRCDSSCDLRDSCSHSFCELKHCEECLYICARYLTFLGDIKEWYVETKGVAKEKGACTPSLQTYYSLIFGLIFKRPKKM